MVEETKTAVVCEDGVSEIGNAVQDIYTALPLSGDRATAIETATRVLTLSGAKALIAETVEAWPKDLSEASNAERLSLVSERITGEAHDVSGWVVLVAERVGFPERERSRCSGGRRREAREILGKTIAVLYVAILSEMCRGKIDKENVLRSERYDLSMVCRLLESPKEAGSITGLDPRLADLLCGLEVDCAISDRHQAIRTAISATKTDIARQYAVSAVKAVIAGVGPDVASARRDGVLAPGVSAPATQSGSGTNTLTAATEAAKVDATVMERSEAVALAKPDAKDVQKAGDVLEKIAAEEIVVAPQMDIRTLLSVSERRSAMEAYAVLAKPIWRLGPKSPVDEIEAQLVAEMPNMSEAIEAICGDLRFGAQFGRRYAWARPTLLLGPPGCGKTRFCRRLSETMGIPLLRINAAGSSDNLDLAGSSSQFNHSQPSAVTKMMATSYCANPMVMIDEVCKVSEDRRNGNVHDTLISMLEPESAASWRDEFLGTSVNLRWVNWVLTANDLDTIPAPLLDRLRVVDVKPPPGDALDQIVKGFAADTAREYGGDIASIPTLDQTAMARLREVYERHGSLRAVQEAWRNEITVLIGGKTVARRTAPEFHFGFCAPSR